MYFAIIYIERKKWALSSRPWIKEGFAKIGYFASCQFPSPDSHPLLSFRYDAAWGHPAAVNSSLSSRSKRWAPHRRHRRPPPPAAAAGLKRGKEDGRSGRLFSIFTPVVFVDDVSEKYLINRVFF